MDDGYTILIVDTDSRVIQLIQAACETEGYHVFSASTYQKALQVFKHHPVHLIISEIQVEHEKPYGFLQAIRQISQVPIVILSKTTLESFKIGAFQSGADDFISKPFSMTELLLRIQRLFHYYYEEMPAKKISDRYTFPFMHVNQSTRSVGIEGKTVKLTTLEFNVLQYLLDRPEQVISRAELLANVWHYSYGADERIVDGQIKKIRKKIGQYSDKAAHSIRTERGRGYYFSER